MITQEEFENLKLFDKVLLYRPSKEYIVLHIPNGELGKKVIEVGNRCGYAIYVHPQDIKKIIKDDNN